MTPEIALALLLAAMAIGGFILGLIASGCQSADPFERPGEPPPPPKPTEAPPRAGLVEGKIKKGGQNKAATTPRPGPPSGQGRRHVGAYYTIEDGGLVELVPDPSQAPQSPAADSTDNLAESIGPQFIERL